jgi:hypothetical protein
MTLIILGVTALPGPVQARAAQPTVRELEKKIRQRDAIIRNLVRRVEHLERQMASVAEEAAPDPPETKPQRVVKGRGQKPRSPETELAALDPNEVVRTPAKPGKSRSASSTEPTQHAARTNPPAPGQLSVSEDEAERALERTLVATGNLLVPKGYAEVEPSFGYIRRETPDMVVFNLNRNEFAWGLNLRFGLPWESQFEIGGPYNLVQQQVTDGLAAPTQQLSNRWANSFGDLTVGVAKTLVHESGWVPDLLARINYEAPTGPVSSNQVPLPSGQSKLSFSATALKRQDPLVFVGTAGYTKAFQSSQINPGNQINFQIGTFLATSPETTLRGVLQQNFIQDIKINDVTLRGSSATQSILSFGASSILGRGFLADLQVGFGLTNSAPKYSVILSSTYRFGVPGL